MRLHGRWLLWLLPAFALGACADGAAPGTAPTPTESSVPVVPSVAPVTSTSTTGPAPAFPTETFADISEEPVVEEVAAEFQAILNDMAGEGGMAATVMSADGTWSGAAGKADGTRDVRLDRSAGLVAHNARRRTPNPT